MIRIARLVMRMTEAVAIILITEVVGAVGAGRMTDAIAIWGLLVALPVAPAVCQKHHAIM